MDDDADYIIDPETLHMLAGGAASDPSQSYFSPWAAARARAAFDRSVRGSAGPARDVDASAGSGSLTPPNIDPRRVRIPDAIVANIMHGIDAIRGAGNLSLALEIEHALLQLGAGGPFAFPTGSGHRGFGFDWGAFGSTAGQRASYGIDNRSLVSGDGVTVEGLAKLFGQLFGEPGAGVAQTDGGSTSPSDSSMDASVPAPSPHPMEAGPDGGTDGGTDAGGHGGAEMWTPLLEAIFASLLPDSGEHDAGTDAGHDAGTDAAGGTGGDAGGAGAGTAQGDGLDSLRGVSPPSPAVPWGRVPSPWQPQHDPANPDAAGPGTPDDAMALLPGYLQRSLGRAGHGWAGGPGGYYGPEHVGSGIGPHVPIDVGKADEPRRVGRLDLARTLRRLLARPGGGPDPRRAEALAVVAQALTARAPSSTLK